MLEESYQLKTETYYENYRKDIIPLLPKHVNRVLEIGCGTGNTLDYLKGNNYCEWIGGVELFHEAATEAATKLDWIYEGNVEEMELGIEPRSIDMILCLDVLEHLINPQKVVAYLHTLLSPKGIIIASIPNVRHRSVVVPLVFQNKWDYQDCGVLDNTHLKFFVKDTAIDLMKSSGLKFEQILSNQGGRKDKILNLITLGSISSFFEIQYLIKVSNDTL
jgi:2-polyprenyl-3-methyl-5-hydroxy-6-metoxy-1,4-benzoquinol methylase